MTKQNMDIACLYCGVKLKASSWRIKYCSMKHRQAMNQMTYLLRNYLEHSTLEDAMAFLEKLK